MGVLGASRAPRGSVDFRLVCLRGLPRVSGSLASSWLPLAILAGSWPPGTPGWERMNIPGMRAEVDKASLKINERSNCPGVLKFKGSLKAVQRLPKYYLRPLRAFNMCLKRLLTAF